MVSLKPHSTLRILPPQKSSRATPLHAPGKGVHKKIKTKRRIVQQLSKKLKATRSKLRSQNVAPLTPSFSLNAFAFSIPKFVGIKESKFRKHACSSNDIRTGEDSFFVARKTEKGKELCKAIGVADGVGGWNECGVNPADMSHALMKTALNHAHAAHSSIIRNPVEILKKAYEQVVKEGTVKAGTTTSVVIALNESQFEDGSTSISAANLGDSGFVVLRKAEASSTSTAPLQFSMVYKSEAQAYPCGTPFQFGVVPPEHMETSVNNSTSDIQHLENINVKANDVIVVGTDGVFDNLSDDNITEIVNYVYSQCSHDPDRFIQRCAKSLVRVAKQVSQQLPPSLPITTSGLGKEDDITLVVAQVNKHLLPTTSSSSSTTPQSPSSPSSATSTSSTSFSLYK